MTPKTYSNALIKEGVEKSKIAAITTTEGPLLIIAGPGSGKTKTLVERIVYLIKIKQVPPEQILVATFTEKAAKELITRVSNKLLSLNISVNLHEMYIGTLHSIFLRILEDNRGHTRLQKNYLFLDPFDQCYLIYSNLDRFSALRDIELIDGGGRRSTWDKCNNLVEQFNRVSEEFLDANKLEKSTYPGVKVLGKAYKIYRKLLQEENALDFSAIQVEALELLNRQPAVLKALQQKIKYLMIDEYQDTNTIQEMILLKLAAKHRNICVVGDDDQGLYRFRGATIRNILEFPNNFKKGECKQVKLTTNYRSHPGIIDFYNKWMKGIEWEEGKKQFRYNKTITPRNEKFIKTPSVIKVSSNVSKEEYHKEVLSFIKTLQKEKVLTDYNQIAFLFRSVKNEGVLELSQYLESNGINVFSPRSNLFFQRREVMLAIGCLVFIFPRLFEWLKWNDSAWLEIWQYYTDCLQAFEAELTVSKTANKQLRLWCEKKRSTHNTIATNHDYAFSALLYEMLQFPLFAGALDVDLKKQKHHIRPAYNLAILSQLLGKYEKLANITVFTGSNHLWVIRKFFNQYLRFLYDGGIDEFDKFNEYAPSGSVSFMTVHQAKGLEFPIVFVGSLHTVPCKQYTGLDEVLQKKYYHKKPFEPIDRVKDFDFYRLYYTAFSRPQQLLVLTGFEKGSNWPMPSRHFADLYHKAPHWRHQSFKIKTLALDSVKDINVKNEYSFASHVSLYTTCPLQYKFYKEMNFAPVRRAATMFGQLVHQTIEDIHEAVLAGNTKKVTDKYANERFEENYASLSQSGKTYLDEAQKKVALQQILAYKKRHEKKWHLLKETGVKVSLVKEDYILSGRVNILKGKNNTVELVDFKGEKKPDINHPAVQEKLKQYQRQLEIYAHLVEDRTGEKVSKMHLYYTGATDEQPRISFDHNKGSVAATMKEVDQIVDRIGKKDFGMRNIKKSKQLCGDCDMRFYCNMRS